VQVFEEMPQDGLEFLEAELGFFDKVTNISGALYPVPKQDRKAAAVKLAREVSHHSEI
jgi:phosphatidylinositol 4-kinase